MELEPIDNTELVNQGPFDTHRLYLVLAMFLYVVIGGQMLSDCIYLHVHNATVEYLWLPLLMLLLSFTFCFLAWWRRGILKVRGTRVNYFIRHLSIAIVLLLLALMNNRSTVVAVYITKHHLPL
jgi:hypothetical protein